MTAGRWRLTSASLIGLMIMRGFPHDTKDTKVKLRLSQRHNGRALNDKSAFSINTQIPMWSTKFST